LQNSIVIIGGTHAGSRDMHETALGETSGGNLVAMSTLLYQNGVLRSLGSFSETLLSLLLIAIQSFLIPFFLYLVEMLHAIILNRLVSSKHRIYHAIEHVSYVAIKLLLFVVFPYVLMVSFHKYVVFSNFDFNTHSVLLPLFLPLIEFLFGYKQDRTEEWVFSILEHYKRRSP
jgi:hypothetical protein